MNENDVISCSFPKRLVLQDISPPAIPHNFTGSIDSVGLVTLNWDSNVEEDLWGYYVYATNDTLTEFLRVTPRPIVATIFLDTVAIKTLTRSIYYRIAALDNKSNVSKFSNVIELKRPDKVPPSPAIITVLDPREDGIALMWMPSPFVDVKSQTLERKVKGKEWEVIARMNPFQKVYLDANANSGKIYSYRINTKDESGNNTYTDQNPSIRSWERTTYAPPYELTAVKNNNKVVLSWKFDKGDQERLIVYRAEKDKKLRKYKSIKLEGNNDWEDIVDSNTEYKYMIRIYTEDGLYSEMSDIVIAN